jgi:hypothetical protein
MATVDQVINTWVNHNLNGNLRATANGSKLNGVPRISCNGPLLFTYMQPLVSLIRAPHLSRPHLDKPVLMRWGPDSTVTSNRHRARVWWQVIDTFAVVNKDNWSARMGQLRATYDIYTMIWNPKHPALNQYDQFSATSAPANRALVQQFHQRNIDYMEEILEELFSKLRRARKPHTRQSYLTQHAHLQLELERYRAYAERDIEYYALNKEAA